MTPPTYYDDWPTCEATYASLLGYHQEEPASAVSEAIGLLPTEMTVRSEAWRFVRGTWRPSDLPPARLHSWQLSSENQVISRDALRHIDWLLAQLEGKEGTFATLNDRSWTFKISVFWSSGAGHGGPALTAQTMRRLAELDLGLEFDFYCMDDPEEDESEAVARDEA